jgi:hypothetical protein
VKSLVNILEVHLELVGSDSFGPLRGGHLRLMGRIGQIFSLANTPWQGHLRGDYPSYETEIDFDSDSNHLLDEEFLDCLPVLVRKHNRGSDAWPTTANCLLLKQLKPGVSEYMRVGILRVSLHLTAVLPEEIIWIKEYANSESDSSDLVTITIV